MVEVRGVAVEIETADALAEAVDVLVLKHAQGSYGVDAAAKKRLELDPEMELPPGGVLEVPGRGRVGAETVLFLGVPRMPDFGYPEIRLLGRRAVSMVITEHPECRNLALTLHGVGFGLDESACFDAELAGIVDALEGPTGSRLERISIVEMDAGRVERLRHHLQETLTGSVTPSSSTPVRATASDHVFVAMPFSEPFEDNFHYAIEPAAHSSGLLCERIDKQAFTGSIPEHLKERIRSAKLVVADLSEANPNVYLEVGFAWGAGVPTVLLCRRADELKFDVQSERCILYSSIQDLEDQLAGELRQLVG